MESVLIFCLMGMIVLVILLLTPPTYVVINNNYITLSSGVGGSVYSVMTHCGRAEITSKIMMQHDQEAMSWDQAQFKNNECGG